MIRVCLQSRAPGSAWRMGQKRFGEVFRGCFVEGDIDAA